MAAYLVVNLAIRGLGWAKAYRASVPALVAQHGGEYVALSQRVERIEGGGPTPDTMAILKFPSIEAVHALMDSADYAPFRAARIAETDADILVFED